MSDTTIAILCVVGFVISLVIYYELIRASVKSAMKEQTELIKKQNEIMLMMLNKQGVGKDELEEIFLNGKKDFKASLKNN